MRKGFGEPQGGITYSKWVSEHEKSRPGPRIFYLCARRAGPVSAWIEWLERAQALGCDWLWLGELQPRAAGTHPLAVLEPGGIAAELAGKGGSERALKDFIDAAHAAGFKLATDFSPAFVARASRLVQKHPQWFVIGPENTPAVPGGMGAPELAASLVECDFGGAARAELDVFWSKTATGMLKRGFDALVCRTAHRVPLASWQQILLSARSGGAAFWADTLGAPIEVSEALAPAGFDAFFSSACWWDFHAEWFIEQETRLRRIAPTIVFPEEPDAWTATDADPTRVLFRYGFAATAAWGVVLPGIGTRDSGLGTGGRNPPPAPPSSLREQEGGQNALDARHSALVAEIAAINSMKRETPALNEPARLERLNAPDARAVVLASCPIAGNAPPALIALNPNPGAHAEAAAGPLFARLDASSAAARELASGRSPERLDAASVIALEPESLRCFELSAPPESAKGVEATIPERMDASIAIENVAPQLEAGRYPVKRVLGEAIEVYADLIVEGHARPAAALHYRAAGEKTWRETLLRFFDNDRWCGRFVPEHIGPWEFQALAWRDRYGDWREDTIKRRDANQPLASELGEGAALLAEALAAAKGRTQARLAEIGSLLDEHADDDAARADLLLAETTVELIAKALPRAGLGASPKFPLLVERGRARSGAWYECFPRSLGEEGRHGTFDDLIRHLPYIAELGFDIVYLPPIHPIGASHRKGKNNALAARPDDPGSPWAIGSKQGGHTAIHPELGTLDGFHRLLAAARRENLEIALDFAIQCSPDHPWVREHPEWFRWRPDGSIRYAENPPKKYEDIVNVDFFGAGRDALWRELLGVLLYWCGEGVRIFRVDNPHTKSLAFWEWALAEVRAHYPETIFLAEAFTRPKLMHRLAKLGFSQSYTYFTWRETKVELIEYLGELTTGSSPEYFRPNFWVNTPDINPVHLHASGRVSFVIRAVLAATLVPSWGMYSGYELCEAEPLLNADGTEREEYLDSEKYELKHRDFDAPGNIRAEIAALNRIRRENPAFAELTNLNFHPAYNDQLMFYSKRAPDNLIWVLVSLDPHQAQEADIELPLEMLGADEETPIAVENLFDGERWQWRGRHQHVRLDPERPAMILRVSGG
ncbi:MAG: maltotransferase domain-containing protein [Gammaproteobacteria bacterium]